MTEVDGDHLLGDYYAFEWGNALFVATDPYWYTTVKPYPGSLGGEKNDETSIGTRWSWTLGKAQYDWLKATLENSQASMKFVFAHQTVAARDSDNYGRGGALAAVCAEMGGMNIDGTTSGWNANRAGWAAPVHKLLVDNHVTAFFHGHDHVYAKETKDGVVYQEVPMAAYHNANDDNMGHASSYTGATLLSNSGHLRVTVGATGASVQYVRSSRNAGRDGLIQTSYTMPGCTVDQDGDGTTDCYDKCPAHPGKIAPGQCCCASADTDTDGDGTADCNDGCPNDKPKIAPGCSDPPPPGNPSRAGRRTRSWTGRPPAWLLACTGSRCGCVGRIHPRPLTAAPRSCSDCASRKSVSEKCFEPRMTGGRQS